MRTSVLHSTKLLKLSRLLGLLNLQAPRRKVGCCSHASRDGKTELSRGKYAAFGRVVAGMEVLDTLEKEEVDGETPKRRLELIEATLNH